LNASHSANLQEIHCLKWWKSCFTWYLH